MAHVAARTNGPRPCRDIFPAAAWPADNIPNGEFEWQFERKVYSAKNAVLSDAKDDVPWPSARR